VITPRATRLIRAADLHAFHHAILSCLPGEPAAARACAVIVPSRAAAEELRRTIENVDLLRSPDEATRSGGDDANGTGTAGSGWLARALPDLVTRDELYERLRERMPAAPAPLSAFDREVLLRRSAHAAHTAGVEPPFNLRPGLIGEILGLYDELRRRHRTVADFERLMTDRLESSAEFDRGAARLLAQTRFLAATFVLFEAAVATVPAVDEHGVRALALMSPRPLYRRVVITVGDQAADRHGLWATDFDLLTRMPGLEAIDVVATEALLAAGFYERLHENILPGLEDVRFEAAPGPPPVLVVPDVKADQAVQRAFVCRDREEELAEFARAVKSQPGRRTPLGRTAIVFQRPLPYLYLARQVFGDARIPYQALDSLPLAGEPIAAAVDVVFTAIAADFTRGALLELLRSPHLLFAGDGAALSAADIHALDRYLVDQKYLGSVERLLQLAERAKDKPPSHAGVIKGLALAGAVASDLSSAVAASTAPAQIDAIVAFLSSRERRPSPADPWHARHMRARAAVLAALQMLRDAHANHDPSPLSVAELSGAVRRWIEGQTFSPRLGTSGIMLLDARAAAYADVDEVRIVGLTESDWPERGGRSIFYPQSLLAELGWPGDQDRLAAGRAQFQDLLRLPRRRVSLSTFTLEEDSIVSPSSLLEEVDTAALPIERLVTSAWPAARVFTHEAIAIDPVVPGVLQGNARDWLTLRSARVFDHARFRGHTGARAAATYAVSRMERYLECPFKYFATTILKLPEEREEQAWMTSQERGHFVHEVFESFFTEWQALGHAAITTSNVGEAIALFEAVGERHLAELPEGDRALERTLLLGSAVAPGFGERAFAFEIEDSVPVIERLLEFELEDTFAFAADGATRLVSLRSKADRIDLLQDGTFRVVDYKLGRAPEKKRSLQLPIYGACAQQALEGRHGKSWTLSRAGYIAFKEKAAFTPVQQPQKAMLEGQERLLAAIDAVERGEFPVDPDEPFLCTWCAYPGVCRKDYVGDE
jgi:RecB family exonuclease